MVIIKKPIFVPGSSLAWHSDDTYSEVTRTYVDGVEGADETAAKLHAIVRAGIVTNQAHPNDTLKKAGVHALDIEVDLLADEKAVVTVRWGVPPEPLLDGDWVVETYSESVRELRAVDVNDAYIKNKYLPPGQSDPGFFALADNKLRFNPGVQVGAFDTIVHVAARRHISFDAAAKFPKEAPLYAWPAIYTNYVNAKIDVGDGWLVDAGIWLCRGIRISTRNNGFSFLVSADMTYRAQGWEDFNIFVHPIHNQRPDDVTWPAGVTKAWPDNRGPTAPRYGVIRPQMLKGLKDFGAAPLGLILGAYTP